MTQYMAQAFGGLTNTKEQRQIDEALAIEKQLKQAQIMDAQRKAVLGDPASTPAAVQEWKYFSQLPQDQQSQYLGMKRAAQTLNLGGEQAVLNPLGGIQNSYPVTPKPDNLPELKRQQAEAAAIGSGLGEQVVKDIASTQNYGKDSAIAKLIEINKKAGAGSFQDIKQFGRQIVPGASETQINTALLKQGRIDLAAPLAKELGVNPTDRDFNASLDRIFDINEPREVREAQLQKLIADSQRNRAAAQMRLSGQQNGGRADVGLVMNQLQQQAQQQGVSLIDGQQANQLGGAAPQPPSLYEQGKNKFNKNKQGRNPIFNPATGEFE